MTGITCYDTILNSQYPNDAAAYAAYVDGHLADQPNYPYIVSAFPGADHLSVTLLDGDADAADVENGAMVPSQVPAWHARQVARGITRPVVYAPAITMSQGVLPVLERAGIALAQTRLWTAHYGDGEHICGPGTCRLLGVPADGTQWTPNSGGRDLDQSLLLPDFFGVPVPPPAGNWTFGAPGALSAQGGHTTVRLTWAPPVDAPVPATAYRIWVYRGTRADKSTLVASYPRTADGVLTWEGGSLATGKVYTAHVSAMGPNGTRLRAFCYASAIFATA
jgi:hypothetical protein